MAIIQRLILVLLLLLTSSGLASAANSTREDRAYTMAVTAFNEANWDRAQTLFAQFAGKYDNSTNVPMAILLESQSLYKLGRFDASIALLNDATNLARAKAVDLADQYMYWVGEAHYTNQHYQQAADAFLALANNYPKSPLQLRALIEAAAAYVAMNNWEQVVALMTAPDGVFVRARQQNPSDEFVVRGELFLSQARLRLNDVPGAVTVLAARDPQVIQPPALGWSWALLRFQVDLGRTNVAAALADTTNMLAVDRLETSAPDHALHQAEATAEQAGLLEQSGQLTDALTVYQHNLGPDVP